jgi:arsenical pump membrane protein
MFPPLLAHSLLLAIVALSILLMLLRPRGIAEVYWVGSGALLLLLLRLIPLKLAAHAIAKGLDVYLFLIGMMLLSELARAQGVFDWVASTAVQHARGSGTRLFTLVYAIGTIVTIFMSNDATAVVLTPAILTAVKKAKAQPLPHLFTCALIANAASFVLPISNPANLVLFQQSMPPLGRWLLAFGLPSIASITVTYLTIRFIFRKTLAAPLAPRSENADGDAVGNQDETAAGNQDANQTASLDDSLRTEGKLVLAGLALVIVTVLTASACNRQLGLPTCLAALVVTAIVLGYGRLNKGRRAMGRIPIAAARTSPLTLARAISWPTLALVAALFILVDAIESVGALHLTQQALQWAQSLPPAVGAYLTAFVVGLTNNLVNNLPLGLIAGATLQAAHAQVATSLHHLIPAAVLIGVDLGPNLAVTGSLATILWLLALRKDNLDVSFWDFLKVGAIVMPLALAASITTSLITSITAALLIAR